MKQNMGTVIEFRGISKLFKPMYMREVSKTAKIKAVISLLIISGHSLLIKNANFVFIKYTFIPDR